MHVFHNVVGILHHSNGFDDFLSNLVTTPELTIADTGRLLHITVSNEESTDARLDVYMANSLGHRLPGLIFSSLLPQTPDENEEAQVDYSY